jgi:hypothetical protein
MGMAVPAGTDGDTVNRKAKRMLLSVKVTAVLLAEFHAITSSPLLEKVVFRFAVVRPTVAFNCSIPTNVSWEGEYVAVNSKPIRFSKPTARTGTSTCWLGMPTTESPVIVNPGVTVKLVAEIAIPSVVVSTRIGPVVAKGGTVAVIVLEESVLIVANTPLNVTLLTFAKLVPEISTIDI